LGDGAVFTGAGVAAEAEVTGSVVEALVVVVVAVWLVGAAALCDPLESNTAPPTRTRAATGAITIQGEVLDFLLILLYSAELCANISERGSVRSRVTTG
jgi:hypothetical protein